MKRIEILVYFCIHKSALVAKLMVHLYLDRLDAAGRAPSSFFYC